MKSNKIVLKLKKETNNSDDIIYRDLLLFGKKLILIFNEPLTSSDKISNFVIRSLNRIDSKKKIKSLNKIIINNISNFKITELNNYDEIVFYLNRGFVIIVSDEKPLALETKAPLYRSISTPIAETTVRGSRDSFVEDIQLNTGLIKKRIKSNNLWIKNFYIGKETKTKTSILYMSNLSNKSYIKAITKKLNSLNIDGIIDGEVLKNLLIKKNNSSFPVIQTTERPDLVCNSLLEGKVAIIIDNSCYALVLPVTINDFFKTPDDIYSKNISVTFIRILKFLAFFIAITGPGLYIALVNYNQEIIPTKLLVNFATQRSGVPFPAFVEAFVMIFAFDLIREADIRMPSVSTGSLSIVGALILGEAAVNAGIVSPIMIITIAFTAICSLPFTEPEFINSLRIYRIIFMIGGTVLGVVGIVMAFIFFLINLVSTNSLGIPYLMPFSPIDPKGIKDSIIKVKTTSKTIRSNKLGDQKK